MVKKCVRLLRPVILLAALCVPGRAQDAKTILNTAEREMGAGNLRAVQYSGSGSSYGEKGEQSIITSYSRQLDLKAGTSNLQITRKPGTPTTLAATANSPWNTQFDFWLTPYGFLKGAMANDATAETKTVDGEQYRVVTFTLPGNHRVSGYINPRNLVERVETNIDNDVLIQSIFRDYQDFSGLKVPTIVIEKRAGMLSTVVIIKEVKGTS